MQGVRASKQSFIIQPGTCQEALPLNLRHMQQPTHASRLWEQIQRMNTSRPDLIINPHAFPSRMTIGMLIESLVSKAGALGGRFVNATPFQKAAGGEEDPISRVAEALEGHGFHRHGGEAQLTLFPALRHTENNLSSSCFLLMRAKGPGQLNQGSSTRARPPLTFCTHHTRPLAGESRRPLKGRWMQVR